VTDDLGERFARALGSKDADGLKAVLRADVDFRAMTPSKFWEAHDRDEVVDRIMLGTWFDAGDDIVDVVSVETSTVGPKRRVAYRFKVTNADGDHVVEQQAYLEPDGDVIGSLRIMCAGYLRAEYELSAES
jgi:hypothetical protein